MRSPGSPPRRQQRRGSPPSVAVYGRQGPARVVGGAEFGERGGADGAWLVSGHGASVPRRAVRVRRKTDIALGARYVEGWPETPLIKSHT